MPEIKTPLISLPNDSYLITEDHTLKDVLRFVLSQAGDSQDYMDFAEQVFLENEELNRSA